MSGAHRCSLPAQATQALHEQLRRQAFQLCANPRMLPREFTPQQVNVAVVNTPAKTPAAPGAKQGRGRGHGSSRAGSPPERRNTGAFP